MGRYRLKRKTKSFNAVLDASRNIIGSTVGSVGSALDTKAAGTIGAVAGGVGMGSTIAGGLTSLGGLAGPVGMVAGAALGAALTRGIGKGMKNAGEDLKP